MDRGQIALEKLIKIGLALSSVRELEGLLEMIVAEARNFANCDAGSLYLVEGHSLRFVVSQNDTLARRAGRSAQEQMFKPFNIPLSNKSLAGYVAVTGRPLNIPDAYKIPEEAEYHFDKSFDLRNDYRTVSMLQVPLSDGQGQVVGVLQLINAKDASGAIVPFGPEDERLLMSLASQAGVAVRNAQLNQELKQAHMDTIVRLGVAAEYRDKETGNHIRRMSYYSAFIAQEMGLSAHDVDLIRLASPMHDVGKVGIPDAILLKPGRLNELERKIMESHTAIGAEILKGSEVPLLTMSQTIALTHHEKWDGSGYPNRLRGPAIPLEGRIVALADVFDALSNKRVYKPAMTIAETRQTIEAGSGAHFDPAVVQALWKCWDRVMEIYEHYKEI
jgi:putative two-component system response regulator